MNSISTEHGDQGQQRAPVTGAATPKGGANPEGCDRPSGLSSLRLFLRSLEQDGELTDGELLDVQLATIVIGPSATLAEIEKLCRELSTDRWDVIAVTEIHGEGHVTTLRREPRAQLEAA